MRKHPLDGGYVFPQRHGFHPDRAYHAQLAALAERVWPDRQVRVFVYEHAYVSWAGGVLLYLPHAERLEEVLRTALGEQA